MIQLTKAEKQVPKGKDQHFEYIWVLPFIPLFLFPSSVFFSVLFSFRLRKVGLKSYFSFSPSQQGRVISRAASSLFFESCMTVLVYIHILPPKPQHSVSPITNL